MSLVTTGSASGELSSGFTVAWVGSRHGAWWSTLVDAVSLAGGVWVDPHETSGLGRVDNVICLGDADGALSLVSQTRVGALVLIDTDMGPEHLDDLADLDELAVLTVIDPRRRELVVGAIEGHLASTHADSDLIVDELLPVELAEAVVSWLQERNVSGVSTQEVSLTTSDGWLLGGDLYRPAESTKPVAGWPAVVLMHSGRSDRVIFHRLGRLLAAAGVVALALDWRGRGTSTNLGHFVDFTAAQQATVRIDAVTAYDWLAGHPWVDGERLGVLGVAHGAGYGADGVLCDRRTKAMAMLTAHHVVDDAQREALSSGRVAGLYVTCRPHPATTKVMTGLFELSAARGSRLLVYPEGVLGYQLFELHPELEPTIAAWFAEVLA